MNSIKPLKKENDLKISQLKLPFKRSRRDLLKSSNMSSARTPKSENGDDDENAEAIDSNRSEASKVDSTRDTIIVPQFKYVAADVNDVIEQQLPFLCFDEKDDENVNIYGVDIGGYSIAVSHYCSKNKNIINFCNLGRNSLYIEKYGLKTEIFLPHLVLTDILGQSITEVKDILKSFYSFPGCDADAMESDVYRLQLFFQKSDPAIVYSVEQLYLLLLYKVKEMIISNSLNCTEPINILFAVYI